MVRNKFHILGLFALDLILKYLAVRGEYAVINQGVAFGVIIGSDILYWVLISVVFVWLYQQKLWLILAGGAANVVSRIVWGGVVDYWNFVGIFDNNLADWMIAGGVVGYLLYLFRRIGESASR